MKEDKIMSLMDEINYGWVDKNGSKHVDDFDTFSTDYVLQSPQELIKSKLGVCWDQVELERYYFQESFEDVKTYFIVHYDNAKSPTHTFLVFKKDNYYYWFEHSWEMFRGIYKFHSLRELLSNVREKFIKTTLYDKYIKENLVIYEYNKPKFNISVQEFFDHCDNGKYVDIENM